MISLLCRLFCVFPVLIDQTLKSAIIDPFDRFFDNYFGLHVRTYTTPYIMVYKEIL